MGSNRCRANSEYDILKDKSLSIQMVPEPTTIALIALGFGRLWIDPAAAGHLKHRNFAGYKIIIFARPVNSGLLFLRGFANVQL